MCTAVARSSCCKKVDEPHLLLLGRYSRVSNGFKLTVKMLYIEPASQHSVLRDDGDGYGDGNNGDCGDGMSEYTDTIPVANSYLCRCVARERRVPLGYGKQKPYHVHVSTLYTLVCWRALCAPRLEEQEIG